MSDYPEDRDWRQYIPWRARRSRASRRRATAGQLVGELLDKHGAKRELREHRIAARWASIVGPRIAARTVPDGLSKGVLWIRVASSAWLHELSFLKDELAAQVNAAVGDPPLVTEVRFHLGGRRKFTSDDTLAPTVSLRREPPRQRPLPPPATGSDLAEIEAETATVSDPELRRLILEARRKLGR
jgi:predicted nucleic acid-binding Zn ribbon protein